MQFTALTVTLALNEWEADLIEQAKVDYSEAVKKIKKRAKQHRATVKEHPEKLDFFTENEHLIPYLEKIKQQRNPNTRLADELVPLLKKYKARQGIFTVGDVVRHLGVSAATKNSIRTTLYRYIKKGVLYIHQSGRGQGQQTIFGFVAHKRDKVEQERV